MIKPLQLSILRMYCTILFINKLFYIFIYYLTMNICFKDILISIHLSFLSVYSSFIVFLLFLFLLLTFPFHFHLCIPPPFHSLPLFLRSLILSFISITFSLLHASFLSFCPFFLFSPLSPLSPLPLPLPTSFRTQALVHLTLPLTPIPHVTPLASYVQKA